MNRRIWLTTGLLLLSALGVLAFQAYWLRGLYQQTARQVQQESQAALAAVVPRARQWQRQQLLRQYQQWLRDTSHVGLSCSVNEEGKTLFRVYGVRHGRPIGEDDESYIGFEGYPDRLSHLTPAAREYFIRHFTEGTIGHELASGFTIFHTQWLGRQLTAAQQRIVAPPRVLRRLMGEELARRGLADLPFRLQTDTLSTTAADRQRFPVQLRPQSVGLAKSRPQRVGVRLPAASTLAWARLQRALLASGVLMSIMLGCVAYAVGTMRRQKQLADLKDDFTHNLTHELKTPVATIQLATDSLRHFDLGPAATAEYAGLIGAQARRLGTLIDQILRSVALEQNALPLARQPLDVQLLLRELVAEHRPYFAQTGQELVGPTGPAPPLWLRADAAHLTNALATLLDNARKYGGPHVSLRPEATATTLRLHLHDDGPGIPATYHERVFEKFFRVPTGNQHPVKGYGLGLHYARQVAQRHGGTLTLRSAPGRGTTFTLTLPR